MKLGRYGLLGKGSSLREGVRAVEQAPQGNGYGTKAARVQKSFRQCSQTYGLIFRSSCVGPGVGLYDLCGFLLRYLMILGHRNFLDVEVVFL